MFVFFSLGSGFWIYVFSVNLRDVSLCLSVCLSVSVSSVWRLKDRRRAVRCEENPVECIEASQLQSQLSTVFPAVAPSNSPFTPSVHKLCVLFFLHFLKQTNLYFCWAVTAFYHNSTALLIRLTQHFVRGSSQLGVLKLTTVFVCPSTMTIFRTVFTLNTFPILLSLIDNKLFFFFADLLLCWVGWYKKLPIDLSFLVICTEKCKYDICSKILLVLYFEYTPSTHSITESKVLFCNCWMNYMKSLFSGPRNIFIFCGPEMPSSFVSWLCHCVTVWTCTHAQLHARTHAQSTWEGSDFSASPLTLPSLNSAE